MMAFAIAAFYGGPPPRVNARRVRSGAGRVDALEQDALVGAELVRAEAAVDRAAALDLDFAVGRRDGGLDDRALREADERSAHVEDERQVVHRGRRPEAGARPDLELAL